MAKYMILVSMASRRWLMAAISCTMCSIAMSKRLPGEALASPEPVEKDDAVSGTCEDEVVKRPSPRRLHSSTSVVGVYWCAVVTMLFHSCAPEVVQVEGGEVERRDAMQSH
ncbi:hypothetical protein NDU88_001668 [Pleurodeles waltl]|uniref:Secreted protein n=1 Tax=Pleurodeles waltl TaxID=8319 RepID=A0AAV7P4N7_PLEWA|nr:hypothetical protein NDU88_001668 [Pleurodeles waltl]